MKQNVDTLVYHTESGVEITRTSEVIVYENAITPLIKHLDNSLGVILSSSYEYPARYTRWDIGFYNPPVMFVLKGWSFEITALNDRGSLLVQIIAEHLRSSKFITGFHRNSKSLNGTIIKSESRFSEEFRSRQPSVFLIIRLIMKLFSSEKDKFLGLFGAIGYDVAFQFEPIKLQIPRADTQRDLVLFIPDEIFIVDHQKEQAKVLRYDFCYENETTYELPRTGVKTVFKSVSVLPQTRDHQPGEYAECVRKARESFKRGDLFEVVTCQTFFEICDSQPSELFTRVKETNPSPYGFFMNLGENEYLVGASPEMFVRVTGKRVETCPISGTIERGVDALSDAAQILELLGSEKDYSELTMCTDVDRNDKSRICEPGSVRVIGRRQIELYSRVIHTVDHVEGILREGYDAIDAFLTHMWEVTVTGAPKLWAMQFIENHEHTPRAWYGGAVGIIGFNGDLNTGLILRTIRINNGIAEVRAGATLLYDSIPEDEEKECEIKAASFLDAIRNIKTKPVISAVNRVNHQVNANTRIVLIDHEDSFVHTLANYFRQTGSHVVTYRYNTEFSEIIHTNPNLVVLSPGPGKPSDFALSNTISRLCEAQLPIFGVCLGLQGIVEYFGGKLDILDYPMHGKASTVRQTGDSKMFANIPQEFKAGRYHSIYAVRDTIPSYLKVNAVSEDGVVMGIEHTTLPIAAVQFHPESILSAEGDIGLQIIRNAAQILAK